MTKRISVPNSIVFNRYPSSPRVSANVKSAFACNPAIVGFDLGVPNTITAGVVVGSRFVKMSSVAPVNCAMKCWISIAANCSCSEASDPICRVARGSPDATSGTSAPFTGMVKINKHNRITPVFLMSVMMPKVKLLEEVNRAEREDKSDDKHDFSDAAGAWFACAKFVHHDV